MEDANAYALVFSFILQSIQLMTNMDANMYNRLIYEKAATNEGKQRNLTY